ncbi:lipase [Bacillus wiedmannii]|uniref:alpha/beta hydrolase fold domain-containing protein n=1 Tax=Bacillus wiedmannii TaxID=1890302 RepID=UPI000BF24281|nr:alpha/beta hydrolase fold domain-containing protein [Bacillus wiedmannii]PEI67555.1 lipase [Bacillus wiedmannii]PEK57837.1 lipase [Bacillus wiedmannii]PEL55800.1 lipase [Bacillus wiedmannii]PHB91461.1 lipase [Bacillus wiedmannii]PHC84857.1 lipase [Bacillus wiedmannii]
MKHTTSWIPRGIIQWILTILTLIAFPIIGIISYYILNPSDMDKLMSSLAWATALFPVSLLIVTLFIIVLLILAFWKKAKIAQVILVPLSLLLIFLTVQPITSMLSYANSKDATVSLSSHFFNSQTISTNPMENVVYGKTTDGIELKMDVWPAKETSKNKLKPAVVLVHGGGWVSGDKGEASHWKQWLNDLGYTVFDVQYRMPPQAGWKDEVADIKSALGWVLQNADTYQIDPNKINVMGESAGGNLAMLAAYSMGEEQLPASTNVPEVHVNSVINMYGPADMTMFYNDNPSTNYVHGVMEEYIGGTVSQFPERYKLLSPINYIQDNTPPTITLLGTGDRIVPVEQGEMLDKELTMKNVAHEFYLLPDVDHGFDINPGSLSTQFAKEKVTAFLQRYNK